MSSKAVLEVVCLFNKDKIIDNQFKMKMSLKMTCLCILGLSLLLQLANAKTQLYISVPLTTANNLTHTAHNIQVDINQHLHQLTL